MRTDESLSANIRRSWQWSSGRQADHLLLRSELPLGYSWSGHERDRLFLSLGGRQFVDVSGISGLDSAADGRTSLYLDYDHDGWQDVLLVNNNTPLCELFRNELATLAQGDAPAPACVALRFVGGHRGTDSAAGWSNRDGCGAKVTVRLAERQLVREHRYGEGRAGQNSRTLLVGLGNASAADEIVVRWPSGRLQTVGSVPAGTLVTVYENPAETPDGSGAVRVPYGPPAPTVADAPSAPALGEPLALAAATPGDPQARLRLLTTTATWCAACKRALPQLRQLRDAFSPAEVSLVGVPIDPDDAPENLVNYAHREQPAYELWTRMTAADRRAVDKALRAALPAAPLPATLVLDARGQLLEVLPGIPSVSRIRQLLAEHR